MRPRSIQWLAQIPAAGPAQLRIGRAGDRLVAEWPGIGTFHALPDGTEPEFVPAPGAPARAVDKLSSGLTPALLRHLQGRLTLHASAAQIGESALACLGDSGMGKSTQIAAILRSHQAALIADDTLAIDFDEQVCHRYSTEPVNTAADARAALGLDTRKARSRQPSRRAPRPLRLLVDWHC